MTENNQPQQPLAIGQEPLADHHEPIYTEEQLLKDLSEPRRMATDTQPTADEQPTASGQKPTFTFPPAPEAQPETDIEPEEPQPVFPTEPMANGQEPTAGYQMPAAKAKRKLMAMLKGRDILQARVLAKLALMSDKARFKMTEDEFDILVDAYMPYMEEHGGRIPVWIDILIAESIVLGDKVVDAMNVRKKNLEIERLTAENEKLKITAAETIHSLMANGPQPTANRQQPTTPGRRNYSIDDNGFYIKDAINNRYLKISDRVEKASLNDLARILEDNEAATVKKVFNLNDEQIS